MKRDHKEALVMIFVALAIGLLIAIQFRIWRLVHPDAPAWTFLFK